MFSSQTATGFGRPLIPKYGESTGESAIGLRRSVIPKGKWTKVWAVRIALTDRQHCTDKAKTQARPTQFCPGWSNPQSSSIGAGGATGFRRPLSQIRRMLRPGYDDPDPKVAHQESVRVRASPSPDAHR